MKPAKEKSDRKRKAGRPEKRVIQPIPDTPENVARALFGIKSDNPEIESIKREYKKHYAQK